MDPNNPQDPMNQTGQVPGGTPPVGQGIDVPQVPADEPPAAPPMPAEPTTPPPAEEVPMSETPEPTGETPPAVPGMPMPADKPEEGGVGGAGMPPQAS